MPGFEEAVKKGWQLRINGNPMFQLTTKLKKVKQELLALSKREKILNPATSLSRAKEILNQIQSQLSPDPLNPGLTSQEKEATNEYIEQSKREEGSTRLKARAM